MGNLGDGMEMKIRTMTATGELGYGIDLNRVYQLLARDNGGSVDYNPEEFPGVRYKISVGESPFCLIFRTGKVVIGGVTSMEQLGEVSSKIEAVFKKYQFVAEVEAKLV